jgi:hypothetical protein
MDGSWRLSLMRGAMCCNRLQPFASSRCINEPIMKQEMLMPSYASRPPVKKYALQHCDRVS